LQTLVKDLNHLYAKHPSLFQHDFDNQGFSWVDCNDTEKSIISFTRQSGNESLLIVLNFTPIPRENYRIGVSEPGVYSEIFNSDSEYYAGSSNPPKKNLGYQNHAEID
jgi:1,4-alpha-glucan branching enzyme